MNKGCNFPLLFLGLLFVGWFLLPYYKADSRIVPIPEEKGVLLPPPPILPPPRFPYQEPGLLQQLFGKFQPCQRLFKPIIHKCDYRELRPYVLTVVQSQNSGDFNLGQVCDVFDYIKKAWRYINDPAGEEYFAFATESWKLQKGDCDDFAICLASALRAIGGYPTIVLAASNSSGNAYVEIALSAKDNEDVLDYLKLRYHITEAAIEGIRKDDNGNYYLNLDWWTDYPGGRYFPSARHSYVYHLQECLCQEIQ